MFCKPRLAVPLNERDYSAFILSLQSSDPDQNHVGMTEGNPPIDCPKYFCILKEFLTIDLRHVHVRIEINNQIIRRLK